MPLAFSSDLQVQNLEREKAIKCAMVKNQIHFTSHTVQRTWPMYMQPLENSVHRNCVPERDLHGLTNLTGGAVPRLF